jgi:hypothetical protein
MAAALALNSSEVVEMDDLIFGIAANMLIRVIAGLVPAIQRHAYSLRWSRAQIEAGHSFRPGSRR